MATAPFLPDETKPGASDLISLFPAVEQTFRDVIEDWILVGHNTDGEHKAITVNSGGGTNAVITEDGVDISSAGAQVWDIQNSGAGAMTLKVDAVVVPTVSSAVTLTNKTLTDANISGAIRQSGDTTTKITFATATMTHEAGGAQRMHINSDGVRLSGGGARAAVILDQDSFSSDRDDALATQQSIKAFVDTSVTAVSLITYSAKTTTSGTTKSFTGIPAGTNRITFMLSEVGVSGNDELQLQIGDVGGYETGAYSSKSAGGTTQQTTTGGFLLNVSSDSSAKFSGVIILTRITDNVWVSNGNVFDSVGSDIMSVSAGRKSLSDELTQIRIKPVGSNTFANGKVNIITEV